MKNQTQERNRRSLDLAAAVIRSAALLTATALTRFVSAAAAGPAFLAGTQLDAFLALGALYVLVTGLVDRTGPRLRLSTDALVCLDVFYITGLVWHTGGIGSDFYLLYYLPILNASMRLDFRQAILSSLLAAVCYAFVTVAAGLESTVVSSAAVQLATFGGSAAVLALFFGSMAAMSSRQRELTNKLQDAVQRLSALYRIARAVHGRDSLQNVTDTTLELAMELVSADVGYVALSNEAGELLVKCSRAAPGTVVSDPNGLPAFDRHWAEHALVARAPLVTTSAGTTTNRGPRPEGPSRCAISAPLTYGDAAYGAVQVFTATTTWEERTLDLLAALAQEAAVAMENARLLTEVRRLSVTDELTGLYHRSEFRRLLEEEVERARAGGGSVAVLLFDIDGMRAINTEHGHQAGDEVLLAFADMLRRFIRAQDVAARYGGDEFAVLLPGGGFDGARAVANRLCHNLAQKPFHFAGEQAAHHFTISVGVVVATEMPNNGDQLVGRADQALFEARRVGGGQVRFWPAHGIGPRHPCLGEDGIIGQLGRMVSGRRDPSGPEGASEQWR